MISKKTPFTEWSFNTTAVAYRLVSTQQTNCERFGFFSGWSFAESVVDKNSSMWNDEPLPTLRRNNLALDSSWKHSLIEKFRRVPYQALLLFVLNHEIA